MNIFTALQLITEVHPTRNTHEDYVTAIQQIANEALTNPELTPSQAAHFIGKLTSPKKALTSAANGAKAGATHTRKAAERRAAK